MYIYSLTNPNTNEIKYVGKTIDLSKRLYQHTCKNNLKKSKTRLSNWINSLIRQGSKPNINVLEEVNYNNWREKEIFWIAKLKKEGVDLCNHTIGGDGVSGFKWTDEMKINKSLQMSKFTNSKGSKRNKEQLEQMSTSRKGKYFIKNKPVDDKHGRTKNLS